MTRWTTPTSAHHDSGHDLRDKLTLQRDHASRHYRYFNAHEPSEQSHQTLQVHVHQTHPDPKACCTLQTHLPATTQPTRRVSLHQRTAHEEPPDIHMTPLTKRTRQKQKSTPVPPTSSPATQPATTTRSKIICGHHRHSLSGRPEK